jgi:GINS complex subunit 1
MSGLNDGKGMDLTLYKKPPKRLYIQVRCLTDYGDYQLEDGTSVVLSKDSTHYLPLAQCEKLIQQGILEQIIA